MALVLAGCGEKEMDCPDRDYSQLIDQSTTLLAQNTQCQTEKTACGVSLAESKATNNQLKLDILNNRTTTCVQTSCNTVVRLLGAKEEQLEDCWLNSNATIINQTTVWHNSTMANLLSNCTQMLTIINNTLN